MLHIFYEHISSMSLKGRDFDDGSREIIHVKTMLECYQNILIACETVNICFKDD